jgi:hypothetical protein
MDYSAAYLTAFNAVSKQCQLTLRRPEVWIANWERLVTLIEEGYDDIPPELDNDIDIHRGSLNAFLHHISLQGFPEHQQFVQAIDMLDNRFNEASFPHPERNAPASHWWYGRVMKKGTDEYISWFDEPIRKRIALV